MNRADRIAEAVRLMERFVERTAVGARGPQHRYLWTDAFAVLNFLGFAKATGEARFSDLALSLVASVHHVLGRHRSDDERQGWISGLPEEEGERHPTRGGLRIGKKLRERAAAEPFDEDLEWDRDGQYFHYLTKWMQALDHVAVATGQPRFNRWAQELAVAAYRGFSRRTSASRPALAWKMSIDLSRPLVSSMGQHDALDGFLTGLELRATAMRLTGEVGEPELGGALLGLGEMIDGRPLATADPLGIGGLLVDAYRAARLRAGGALPVPELPGTLVAAATEGLQHYAQQQDFRRSAQRRLGFRELGLTIGLQAAARIPEGDKVTAGFGWLGATVEDFWREPAHRDTQTWRAHQDINDVMLATSLAPAGLLDG